MASVPGVSMTWQVLSRTAAGRVLPSPTLSSPVLYMISIPSAAVIWSTPIFTGTAPDMKRTSLRKNSSQITAPGRKIRSLETKPARLIVLANTTAFVNSRARPVFLCALLPISWLITRSRWRLQVHHKRRLTFVALGLCALVLLPALLDRPAYQLVLSPEQWVPDANFFGYGKAGLRDLPPAVVHSPNLRLWNNYSVATGLAPGRLETLPFLLEKEELFIPV